MTLTNSCWSSSVLWHAKNALSNLAKVAKDSDSSSGGVFSHNLIPDPNQRNRKGSGQHLFVQLELFVVTFSHLAINLVNNHKTVCYDVVQFKLGAQSMVDFVFFLINRPLNCFQSLCSW
jgi:hypothetical protein